MADRQDNSPLHRLDRSEVDKFFPLVYEELRRRAVTAMRRLPPGQTLQPTALVNEAYTALATRQSGPWRSQEHFLAVATLAIRHCVVDKVRERTRAKRGDGARPVPLMDDVPIAMPQAEDAVILGVDRLLEQLRAEDPRAADVVVFRFFVGMSERQIAEVLGVTDRTVRRDWTYARAWLSDKLAAEGTSWAEEAQG